MAEKETPLVGVEPDASYLPDECPRLLDHRGILICHLITYPSDSSMSTAVAINIIYKTSSAHCICAVVTTAHLFHASVWMVYHHLNN